MVTSKSKWLKLFRSEIENGCNGGHLENLFYAASPESKGLKLGRTHWGDL